MLTQGIRNRNQHAVMLISKLEITNVVMHIPKLEITNVVMLIPKLRDDKRKGEGDRSYIHTHTLLIGKLY